MDTTWQLTTISGWKVCDRMTCKTAEQAEGLTGGTISTRRVVERVATKGRRYNVGHMHISHQLRLDLGRGCVDGVIVS